MPGQQEINLYPTSLSECNYLQGLWQRSLVVDPTMTLTTRLYSHLAARGFRRSGNIAYRPYCPNCQACLPLRICVDQFTPSRSQQRNIKRNSVVDVIPHPPIFNEEHFSLYAKYQLARHPGGSMSQSSRDDFMNFLTSPEVDILFYEFRRNGQLVAVAVTDVLDDALSAVYTFYDPDFGALGLGTYAILWQCQQAQRLNLPWLYLGFWIEQSNKMSYKVNFQPAEIFKNQQWQPMKTKLGYNASPL